MTTVTRQDVLKIEAIGKLNDGGMGTLWRWYRALPEADRALLDDFIVKPGSIPVLDVEPEAEAEPEAVEVEKPKPTGGVWICGNCGEAWAFNPGWCSECGWDGRKDDKMRLEAV